MPEEVSNNFAIYSKYASQIDLLLYSRDDVTQPLYEYEFNPLINKSARVWHCRLRADAIPKARYYAYRISRPNEPGAGIDLMIRRVCSIPTRAPYIFASLQQGSRSRDRKQCG